MIALLAIAVGGLLRDSPDEVTRALFQRALKAVDSAGAIVQETRSTVGSLVGREYYVDIRPYYRTFTAKDISASEADHVAKLSSARKDLLDTWARVLSGKVDRDRFARHAYEDVLDAVRASWNFELVAAGLNNGVLLAPVWRLESRLDEEGRKFDSELRKRKDLTGAQKSALREEFDRQQDSKRKQLFASTVANYRTVVFNLARRRQAWLAEFSNWQQYAVKRQKFKGDVHAEAATNFKKRASVLFDLDGGVEMGPNLNLFANGAGSPDRLITPYGSQAWAKDSTLNDVQYPDSPGVLRMFGIAKAPAGRKDNRFRDVKVTVAWESDGPASGYTYKLREFPDREVLPVQYDAKGEVRLKLKIKDFKPSDHPTFKSFQMKDLNTGKTVLEADANKSIKTFDSTGAATLVLRHDAVLDKLHSEINGDVIEAKLVLDYDGSTVEATTSNVLHILRQKLILFIPGVCGSEIWVADHPNDKAFLAMSLERNPLGSQPARWLVCNLNGDPAPGSEAVQLDLLREYSIGLKLQTVYDVEHRAATTQGLTLTRSDGLKVPYFWVQPWAYDWRLRLEGAVARLAGLAAQGSGPTRPPYSAPPSLARVIAEAKKDHPFLDEKVALVGHSTGGLITKGFLTRPESAAAAAKYVDHAYFVDTPFWGAPKVYYVYLTGDDMVPVIANDRLRHLAPNFPIVYYLAPTEQYPDIVAFAQAPSDRVTDTVRRFEGQKCGGFMGKLVAMARSKKLYPDDVDPWNNTLEAAANSYHRSIRGAPSIGWDKCLVFVSNQGSQSTRGPVAISGEYGLLGGSIVVRSLLTSGDGTVPLVSQKADAPEERIRAIPNAPIHAAAANEDFVWEQIVRDVSKRP